jgi:hypothetical protein
MHWLLSLVGLGALLSPLITSQHVGLPPVTNPATRPNLPDRLSDLTNRRHALSILVNQRQYERHVQMVNRAHIRHQTLSQRVADQHQRRINAWADRHENLHQNINERHLLRVNRTGARLSRVELSDESTDAPYDRSAHLLSQDSIEPEVAQHLNDLSHDRVRRSIVSVVPLAEKYRSGSNRDEQAGVRFLRQHDLQAAKVCREVSLANWDYTTNLTEHNKQKLVRLRPSNATLVAMSSI